VKSLPISYLLLLLLGMGPLAHAAPDRTLSREALLDKIRGAWAGQMIGVVYGAPVEFKSLGKIHEGDIKAFPMSNAIVQDDLYVEMTFARVMDTIGLDATSADYGEAFRNSKYELWHANAGARRNLNRGIPAPLSGDPRYNLHADDIDFQIESDFIGIMCPGLPQTANRYADRVGRVMNYGDGLYGGMFISGMYTAAYFETDPRKIVEAGLAAIPAGSGYAAILRDLLAWSAAEPDWRKVWQQLETKWDKDDVCPDGAFRAFNIDAKLNGAYLALGLLYGKGDLPQTMEIATRCGQDADCNPSSAVGVLGAIMGYRRLPEQYKTAIEKLADRKFSFTDYSFNDIVKSTEARTLAVIRQAGGTVTEREVTIPVQAPVAPPLEQSNFGVPAKVLWCPDPAWNWAGGMWTEKEGNIWSDKIVIRETEGPGNAVTLTFAGTGIALVGDLAKDGGRADVLVDGVKSELVADAFILPRTHDNDLWRMFGLKPGSHTLRIVMRDDADPRSTGHRLTISRAVVYSHP
jgi:hypothetical protein